MRLAFGDFVFDAETRRLTCAGSEVHLEPKAFALLEFLLERRPAVVARPAIRDRLWPGTFVSESNLTTIVSQLRRALGDDPESPRLVRTVRGFGYAFDGVAAAEPATDDRPGPASGGDWLVWRDEVLPLVEGENVLGRDAESHVPIDAPGVSRRHARIVVRGCDALVEDLGSKNGTFLGDRRVEGATPIRDRDRLCLGRMTVITYRKARPTDSTETEGR